MADKCKECGEKRDKPCDREDCPKKKVSDEEFERIAEELMEKYAEVFRRLKDR